MARADRYGRTVLSQRERRRTVHQLKEPAGVLGAFGRHKAWAKVRATIPRRIDRVAAQLDRIEAFGNRYGDADWENGGPGERLAHRKAAAVLPELATAYEPARLAVIQQRSAEAAAEKARVAQLRKEQGRGGFSR